MMRTEYKTVNSEDASHVESDASRFEQSVNNGRFLVAAIVGDRSASQAQYLPENIGRKVISVY